VRRAERDAQACLAARHGRVTDRRHEQSLLAQLPGKRHRPLLAADQARQDRTLRLRIGAESGEVSPQLFAKHLGFSGFQQADRLRCGRRARRRGRGRENEAARAVHEEVDERRAPADRAARRAERLAKRPHLNVDALPHAQLRGEAAAARTEHAHTMRLINHEPCAEPLLELHDLAQRREVAVHAENTLGNDEHIRLRVIFARPGEEPLELPEVVVRKDTDRRTAQPRAIHEAGVAELIEDDDVLRSDERGNCPERGGIAGGETERGLRALEARKRGFELGVRGLAAADESGGAGTRAITIERGRGGVAQARIIGKVEVVVRREVDERATIDDDLGALRGLDRAQATTQVLRLDLREASAEPLVEVHGRR